MALIFDIPDEVVEGIKIPRDQVKQKLKEELAFLLYQKGFVSMGIARKFAGISKWDFIDGLTPKGCQRHYTEKELQEDMEYAKGSK